MNELSLFSGAGGGLLGSKILGWTTRGYVEYENYPQRVIARRIKDGWLDDAPIFGDIRTFISEGYAASYQGMVDIVTGGFPCQPFSVAGKRKAGDDDRDMWPYTIEVIRQIRPRWAFLENVPGLLSAADDVSGTYFSNVLRDLAQAGYDAEWTVLGADDCGAPHRRKRLWCLCRNTDCDDEGQEPKVHGRAATKPDGVNNVAHSESINGRDFRENSGDGCSRDSGSESSKSRKYPEYVAEPKSNRLQAEWMPERGETPQPGLTVPSWWETEPTVGRVANGVGNRVDRLKAIGNGQVPQTMAAAFLELRGRYGRQ